MPAPHRIAQVFLVRGDQILVLQRGSGRGKGWWAPPDYAWIALDDYEQRYGGGHLESAAPEYAAMFREMRADCTIVRAMMRDNKF